MNHMTIASLLYQTRGMALGSVWLIISTGCHTQPPGGMPIQPRVLGESVDEANRVQEENAEQAKLTIYTHEFEINLQQDAQPSLEKDPKKDGFQYQPSLRVRGVRLTPDGQDHVRQLAKYLRDCPGDTDIFVTLERSQSSKSWDTKHHYPVHFNDELDKLRRKMVVDTLVALGVDDADQRVVVAPAYATGMFAEEAAAAYEGAIGSGSLTPRAGNRQ